MKIAVLLNYNRQNLIRIVSKNTLKYKASSFVQTNEWCSDIKGASITLSKQATPFGFTKCFYGRIIESKGKCTITGKYEVNRLRKTMGIIMLLLLWIFGFFVLSDNLNTINDYISWAFSNKVFRFALMLTIVYIVILFIIENIPNEDLINDMRNVFLNSDLDRSDVSIKVNKKLLHL